MLGLKSFLNNYCRMRYHTVFTGNNIINLEINKYKQTLKYLESINALNNLWSEK